MNNSLLCFLPSLLSKFSRYELSQHDFFFSVVETMAKFVGIFRVVLSLFFDVDINLHILACCMGFQRFEFSPEKCFFFFLSRGAASHSDIEKLLLGTEMCCVWLPFQATMHQVAQHTFCFY